MEANFKTISHAKVIDLVKDFGENYIALFPQPDEKLSVCTAPIDDDGLLNFGKYAKDKLIGKDSSHFILILRGKIEDKLMFIVCEYQHKYPAIFNSTIFNDTYQYENSYNFLPVNKLKNLRDFVLGLYL